MKSLMLCCALGAVAVAAEAAPRGAHPGYEAPGRAEGRPEMRAPEPPRARRGGPDPVIALHRRDQDAAFDAVRNGRSLSLPQLERQVTPQIRGDYLGRPEYDAESNVYRMKFMRDGSMIWIDVDGRTGRILRRSGQ